MPRRHGRRKKRRTHVEEGEGGEKAPKSMVLLRGSADKSVTQLMHNVRQMLSPLTARRLRVKRSNKLRDFVAVAGPLGVTHLLAFRQTDMGVNLRIGRLPQGPTLTFRVSRYSLCRSVLSAQKRPAEMEMAYETPPLVVLNGFGESVDGGVGAAGGGEGKGAQEGASRESDVGLPPVKALQLVRAMLQGLFPAINVSTLRLVRCRRVVLFHLDRTAGTLEVRHFLIRAQPAGLSRAVRKVVLGSKVPDLGALEDVAELFGAEGALGGGGFASDTSDSEYEDASGSVTLPQRFAGKGNVAAARSAVRLAELGPRMTLRLLRVNKGLDSGEVLFHSTVVKSASEEAELRRIHAEQAALKKARAAQQKANVLKKQALQRERAAAKLAKTQKKEAQRMLRQKIEEKAASEYDADQEEDEEEEEEEEEDGEDGEDGEEEEDGEGDGGSSEEDGEGGDEEEESESESDALVQIDSGSEEEEESEEEEVEKVERKKGVVGKKRRRGEKLKSS